MSLKFLRPWYWVFIHSGQPWNRNLDKWKKLLISFYHIQISKQQQRWTCVFCLNETGGYLEKATNFLFVNHIKNRVLLVHVHHIFKQTLTRSYVLVPGKIIPPVNKKPLPAWNKKEMNFSKVGFSSFLYICYGDWIFSHHFFWIYCGSWLENVSGSTGEVKRKP